VGMEMGNNIVTIVECNFNATVCKRYISQSTCCVVVPHLLECDLKQYTECRVHRWVPSCL